MGRVLRDPAGVTQASARWLSALLAGAGMLHFITPRSYDGIVPDALPGSARLWVAVSGLAELVVAALIAHPRTRHRGARAAAVLLVLVFPANVKMALDWYDEGWARRVVALARLPLQVPLVVWAIRVSRAAGRAQEPGG